MWGAATAAYQIEGYNTHSDLWDWEVKYEQRSGAAANSYVLFDEDAELVKRLGMGVYRFSIEWARLEPRNNEWNAEAIEHYHEVLRSLRSRNIRPMVTLHHFTNPKWVYEIDPSPWENGEVVREFEEYVRLAAREYGSEVDMWIPFNEPNVYSFGAYGIGRFPPGQVGLLNPTERLLPVMQNMVEAHVQAYRMLHEVDTADADGDGVAAWVGVGQAVSAIEPADPDSAADRAAVDRYARFYVWLFPDAMARGNFDSDLRFDEAIERPDWAGSLDFLGLQYYSRLKVRAQEGLLDPLNLLPCASEGALTQIFGVLGCPAPDLPKTDMGWEIYPEGFYDVVRQAWERYALPVVVTENGIADQTGEKRAPFIVQHLAQLHRAIRDGADVRGYMHWSLLDNYEWGSFRPRFGLYSVDYENGFARELTAGGAVYGEIVGANGISSDLLNRFGSDDFR